MNDDKRDTQELEPITLKDNPYQQGVSATYAAMDVKRELKALADYFGAVNSLPGHNGTPHQIAMLEQGADMIAALSERLIEVVDDIRAGRVDPSLPF